MAITFTLNEDKDYISLTDIAKKSDDDPRFVIRSWIKNQSTIPFLEAWEVLHNEDFNRDQMDTVRKLRDKNAGGISVKKWLDLTGTIGIISKAGR